VGVVLGHDRGTVARFSLDAKARFDCTVVQSNPGRPGAASRVARVGKTRALPWLPQVQTPVPRGESC
jgi:hypothetical protein